jgi:putative phosphoesterase
LFSMRVAIVSDIHGNLTALEAVIADLRQAAPDLILHGGDLAAGGARPRQVVDRVRELGWHGVLGNTDEMLYRPASLTEFAAGSERHKPLFAAIEEMAAFTRDAIGEEPIAWLKSLPILQNIGPVGLVHASPDSLWRSPGAQATDDELESVYGGLATPVAVYAHIHHPFCRHLEQRVVINTGSVSLSYDGDPRASYLLLDEQMPSIRRLDYDLSAEREALGNSGLPHAQWVAHTLEKAVFVMP